MTLDKLSQKSGVSKSVLSDIKTGIKTTLNTKQEIGLAKAFGVETINLYKGR